MAQLAGVSRMTVYNHFPTEFELYMGCSTHWVSHNPFPDLSRWAAIDDPRKRLLSALEELFSWYATKEAMLGNIFRDAPILPQLQKVMGDLWSPYVDEMVGTLARGWPVPRKESAALVAALRLAVDFAAWRVLTESGLDDGAAARATARMVIGAYGRDDEGDCGALA